MLRTIAAHRLFEAGDRVVVAVSGGPDSMALLHALWEVQGRLKLSLEVVGIDHGLRPEAAAELAAVRARAEALELPFAALRGRREGGARAGRRAAGRRPPGPPRRRWRVSPPRAARAAWRSATRPTIRPRPCCSGSCAGPGSRGWPGSRISARRSCVRSSTCGGPRSCATSGGAASRSPPIRRTPISGSRAPACATACCRRWPRRIHAGRAGAARARRGRPPWGRAVGRAARGSRLAPPRWFAACGPAGAAAPSTWPGATGSRSATARFASGSGRASPGSGHGLGHRPGGHRDRRARRLPLARRPARDPD